MAKTETRYAFYQDDVFVTEGTAEELAKQMDVEPQTVRWYSTPAYTRIAHEKGYKRKVFKIDNAVQVDLGKLKSEMTKHGYWKNDLKDWLDLGKEAIRLRWNGERPFKEHEVEIIADLLYVEPNELVAVEQYTGLLDKAIENISMALHRCELGTTPPSTAINQIKDVLKELEMDNGNRQR